MKDLIEALTILAKYVNDERKPTCCERDELYVAGPPPHAMAVDDAVRLGQLGFVWAEKAEAWLSFRFGYMNSIPVGSKVSYKLLMPIAIGDVVRLKSGGPAMTVEAVETDGRGDIEATFVWLVASGFGRERLPAACLERVGPEPMPSEGCSAATGCAPTPPHASPELAALLRLIRDSASSGIGLPPLSVLETLLLSRLLDDASALATANTPEILKMGPTVVEAAQPAPGWMDLECRKYTMHPTTTTSLVPAPIRRTVVLRDEDQIEPAMDAVTWAAAVPRDQAKRAARVAAGVAYELSLPPRTEDDGSNPSANRLDPSNDHPSTVDGIRMRACDAGIAERMRELNEGRKGGS